MKFRIVRTIALTAVLLPQLAFAQTLGTAAPAGSTSTTVAAAEAPQEATAVARPSETADLAARIAKLEDENNATRDLLKKLKITGYVQPRYEAFQSGHNGLEGGKYGVPDTFYIRRARVKFAFAANEWSEYVLQPDFSSRSGLSLKDAYVDLKEQWTKTQKLRIGQFATPYGYEIEESSSVREVPERSLWERTTFPNERERGAALYGSIDVLRYSAAVLNGNSSADKDENFRGVDNNFAKQYIGRAGISSGNLSAGVSGSHNIKLIPAVASDAAEGIPGNANKQYTERLAGVYLTYSRELPVLGTFGLKGEYNRGWTGIFADEKGTTKPGFLKAERRAKMLGWHVLVSQFVTENNQLAYRIEQFDPDMESRDKECNTPKHAPTDFCHFSRITKHTFAWNYFFHKNVRFTTALELPKQPAWKDSPDALFTEQVQYKF